MPDAIPPIQRSRYLRKLPEQWSNEDTSSSIRWIGSPLSSDSIDSFLCEVRGKNGEALGWVLVDSTVQGRSHGGVRLGQDISVPMMKLLARRMTLKFGFVGLANGGGKAGLIADPEGSAEERLQRLKRFGHAIAPILHRGHYTPHPDLGTSSADIAKAFGARRLLLDSREPTRELSGFMTSLSVIIAADRAARFLGKSLNGMKAAIEGFGKVGSAVAQGLEERGVKVVAVSTSQGTIYNGKGLDLTKMNEIHSRLGSDLVHHYTDAEPLRREQISALPVDLFCPCAKESLNANNAKAVPASIISPGANCPVDDEAEKILVSNGKLYVPDFIANCGGVLGGTMSFAGLPSGEIREMMEHHLGARITALFEAADKQGKSLTALAAQESMERFDRTKRNAERQTVTNFAFGFGLKLYRKGLLPQFVTRSLAKRYFLSKLR